MYYIKDFWVTKEFEKIKISEMKTNHIENTIRFLKKHTCFYDECVCSVYDYDYDYEDNSHLVYKKIKELEKELQKRRTII